MIKIRAFALLMFVVLPLTAIAKQAPYPVDDDAFFEEISNLNWVSDPMTYTLYDSNSSLRLVDGLSLVLGTDAERFAYLMNAVEMPMVEAISYNHEDESNVYYRFFESGYVSLEDWADIDADALIVQMIESNDAANIERQKHNLPSLTNLHWIAEPTYSLQNDAVYWVTGMNEGDVPAFNLTTLKLGKSGYEHIVWAGYQVGYTKPENMITAMLDSHAFNSGFQYADFSVGDKVAAFGIASLVASKTTGKSTVSKTAAAAGAGLLVLLKKFIFLPVLLAFGAIAGLFRKIFSSRKPSDDL